MRDAFGDAIDCILKVFFRVIDHSDSLNRLVVSKKVEMYEKNAVVMMCVNEENKCLKWPVEGYADLVVRQEWKKRWIYIQGYRRRVPHDLRLLPISNIIYRST